MTRTSPARISRERWILWLGLTAILLGGVAAYYNSFAGVLLLDDHPTILNNPSIRRLWSPEVLMAPASTGTAGRPFANLTFALNYRLGGTSVAGYHAVNLFVHLATALLVAGVVRRTLQLPRFADSFGRRAVILGALAGLGWAVHPLTTGTVTYLSQRTEALAACGYVATLYGAIRYATTGRLRWAVFAVSTCAAGIASKETVVTAPFAVLVLDAVFVAGSLRGAWRDRWRWYLALASCWILLGVLLASAHLAARGVGLDQGVAPWAYALVECRALLVYLKLSVWPHPLVFDYGWAAPVSPSVAVAAAVAVLTGVTAVAFGIWRGYRGACLGLLWLLLLAPTSSIVPIADQPMAENRAYLPLALVLVAALISAYRLLGQRVFSAVGAAVVALGLSTVHRNELYRTEAGPWRDVLATRPASPRALNALGVLALKSGDVPQAIALHTRAVELRPNYAEAQGNLGGDLYRAGRVAEAVDHFRRAMELMPNLVGIRSNLANALLALGNSRLRAGDARGAMADYEAALREEPRLVAAESNLANALLQTGEASAALQHALAALQSDPRYAAAHGIAANALLQLRQYDGAIEHFRSALALDPRVAATYNGLGLALARKGLPEQAAEQFKAALRVNPQYAPAATNLRELERERAEAASGGTAGPRP